MCFSFQCILLSYSFIVFLHSKTYCYNNNSDNINDNNHYYCYKYIIINIISIITLCPWNICGLHIFNNLLLFLQLYRTTDALIRISIIMPLEELRCHLFVSCEYILKTCILSHLKIKHINNCFIQNKCSILFVIFHPGKESSNHYCVSAVFVSQRFRHIKTM